MEAHGKTDGAIQKMGNPPTNPLREMETKRIHGEAMNNATFNYTGAGWFILIGLAMLIALFMFIPVGSATNVTNQSYVNITFEIAPDIVSYIPTEIVRIEQGQDVYLNGTYDITGITGWDQGGNRYLAYCGGFYSCTVDSNPYLVKLPPPARGSLPSQYAFWIDPAIFSGRGGWWYQYDEFDTAEHGNNVAFRLIEQYQNRTFTFKNGTVITQYGIVIGNTTPPHPSKPTPILPLHPVSNYLLARGDTFTINDNTTEKIWVFGRNTPLYDYETINGSLTYDSALTLNMEPGEYYFLKQYSGINTEFDVRYHENKIQWKNDWFGIESEDISGVQPKLVVDEVIAALGHTDDTYKLFKMEVQEPVVTIDGFTEVPMTPTYTGYQEYKDRPGSVSMFDVRGYTNFRNGTTITVILDPERRTPLDIKYYTFNTTAISYENGNMSEYQVYIPIVWDDMTLGEHTMKAYGPIGQPVYHTFPIGILPGDSYKPNATIKYVMDENPWKPNMTIPDPIIIKEPGPVVIVTHEIPVTPRPEVVQKAQDDAVMKIAWNVVYVIFGAIGVFVVLRFIFRLIKRQRWYKK